MDNLKEIIIPSFVNIHLFWIIEKKDILLRCAMNKVMKSFSHNRPLKNINPEEFRKMVCVNLENVWARALIEDTFATSDTIKYLCWLPDYGVFRTVNHVFRLSDGLEKCPHLSKQASLYNIVNLTTGLVLGNSGYEVSLTKTLDHINGVTKTALDSLDSSVKLFFSEKDGDNFNLYGDIICEFHENERDSLTDFLIKKELVEVDEQMFRNLEASRNFFRKMYIDYRPNCQQVLDKTEKQLNNIIFNREKREELLKL